MRPSWEEYFLQVMDAIALRASCDRGRSACVIVKDKRILATGYVGAPSGLPTCEDVGHQMIKRLEIPFSEMEYKRYYDKDNWNINQNMFSNHCIRTIHSEINALLNCARNGVSTLGATLYCTMVPCRNCAMAIIQAGIEKVVVRNMYQKGKESIEMFEAVGIEFKLLEDKLLY